MQRLAGWSLIIAAVALALVNLSDIVIDLKTWHSATTPQFVGAAMKQLGTVLMAALGGKFLPEPRP